MTTMTSRKSPLAVVCALVALTACFEPGTVTGEFPPDVQDAIDRLPRVQLVVVGVDGLPISVRGDLGSLESVAPVFRLRPAELAPVRVDRDELGMRHLRYQQMLDGVPVIGAELVLHVADDDVVQGATSTARGLELAPPATPAVGDSAVRARAAALADAEQVTLGATRLVYVRSTVDHQVHLAWEIQATGVRAGEPMDDLLFVDAHTGALADRHPRIHSARARRVYSANNGSSLPGALRITEGGASVSDASVMAAYDNSGITYDCYAALFGRDSYNGGGATLHSTVHYGVNYNNAFWNGSQMVYGDGDGSTLGPLALSLDIAAHELTHAVTQYTAGLVYQNEPGALNEAMSDVMSVACDHYARGAIDADTWKLGEQVWTPGVPGDALRYLDDPAADGQSRDYYPDRYVGSWDNGGVHLNSGIANLAFKLLVTGGAHPRGKTSNVVPAIGMDKASKIFYRALAYYMTSSTSFAGARAATIQAATDLYGSAEVAAVQSAWAAVGVGSPPADDPPPPPPPDDDTLGNGVPVTGLSGATGSEAHFAIDVPAGATNLRFRIAGGSGDADLYVRYGAAPTPSTWDYRPYRWGNNETVNASPATAGRWYVMLHGYSAYSGVQLTASYD